MTPQRFLAIVADRTGAPIPTPDSVRILSGLEPATIHQFGRMTLVASGAPHVILGRGLILGALFDRRFPGLVQTLPAAECETILQTEGRHLIGRYWGSYLAFLHAPDDDRIDVVRAPFGEYPCFQGRIAGATVLASDLALLARAGVVTGIDWDGVARELVWPFLRCGTTCMSGVEAMLGGERLSLGAATARTLLWSPWDYVTPDLHRSPEEHAEILRRTVENCVTARASQFGTIQLLLSGGLDSSIVAACLAGRDSPPDLLSLYTRDAIGDERPFGAQMAHAIGLPLREVLRDVTHVDPRMSLAAHLPWPSARLFEQATRHVSAARSQGSENPAVFTGGGGDNVFCALYSAAPAADRLLVSGARAGFLPTVRDISRLAPAAVPTVIGAAIRRCLPWRRASPLHPNRAFMSDTACAQAGVGPPAHPWLAPPVVRMLPGKAAHIRSLVLAQGFAEGHDPQGATPVIHPLLSQPVVECCLAIPSWHWVADGFDRAVARRAFAHRLPPSIAYRRTKGSPECFVGEIFEHHLAALQDLLLGGALAANAIIDCPAVAQAFDANRTIAPDNASELLRLVDVEAWLRTKGA